MREEYAVDPQGRTVRAKHAVRERAAGWIVIGDDDAGGVRLLDISVPDHEREIEYLDSLDSVRGVDLDSNNLYLADSDDTIKVVPYAQRSS